LLKSSVTLPGTEASAGAGRRARPWGSDQVARRAAAAGGERDGGAPEPGRAQEVAPCALLLYVVHVHTSTPPANGSAAMRPAGSARAASRLLLRVLSGRGRQAARRRARHAAPGEDPAPKSATVAARGRRSSRRCRTARTARTTAR
jgi:hypothetical protein